MCFLVFKREREREREREKLGREKNPEKKCGLPWFEGCLGLFIPPTCFSRWQHFKGRQP